MDKPALVGWYECTLLSKARRVTRYWDGERLMAAPGDVLCRLSDYADFVAKPKGKK